MKLPMLGRSRIYRPSLWARIFLSEKWKLALSPSSQDRVSLTSTGEDEIQCLDISSVSSTKALLWHTVEIRSKGRIDALSGLTAKASQTLRDDLLAFVNQHLANLIDSDKERLREVDSKIRAMTDSNRQYLAHADVGRAIASVPGNASLALAHPLFDASLIPDTLRGYGEAIAKALPHADQVADRWHLMENASRAFLDAVGKSMRQIRKAVGSSMIDPKLLTYAERLQYEGFLRRQETNEAILELSKRGVPIKQIVKRTGHSRKLIRSVLRGQRSDVFRVRQSSIEEWLPWLDSRWEQGARNASALWREMRKKGFRGQSGVISEWARRRRLAERADQSALARTPSARIIVRLMTLARDDLSKSDAVLIAAIESNVPDLVTARTLIDDFQQMIRSKTVAKLDAWLEGAKASLIGSFANGIQKDIAAVRNAIISPWSNGQTEGQITKLKLIKRQMYGRAKIDLLQARLIGVT